MKTYDPAWLVDLAKAQEPEEPWLAQALSDCRLVIQETAAYIYFVDPTSANQPGASWQFKENIVLEHPEEGDVVLDILKDGRVGGIEFLSRILQAP